MCLDVASGSKVELVDLMRAMNTLHFPTAVDKLRVAAPSTLASTGVAKDEAIDVFAANLILHNTSVTQ